MNEGIKSIIDLQPEAYEKMLLGTLDGMYPFFLQYGSLLCKSRDGTMIHDFSSPLHNALFWMLHDYHMNFCGRDQHYSPVDVILAKALLENLAVDKEDYGISVEEIDEALGLLFEIRQQDVIQILVPATEGINYWLKKQRTAMALAAGTAMVDFDPDELIGNVISEIAHIGSRDKQSRFDFGHGVDNALLDVNRLPGPFSNLACAMGGGFGKGEHTLFIAPTGAGKTILACQLGFTFAGTKQVGVIVTTEQSHWELEPRIISLGCDIPFHRIKDKFRVEDLSSTELEKYKILRKEMGGRLLIEDWGTDRSRSVVADFGNMIQDIRQEKGRCDFLILDWLGGALGDNSSTDINVYRRTLQMAADAMAHLATTYDITTISFAQANPAQAKNKMNVDMTMCSESKTLGVNATWVWGISALENAVDPEDVDALPTFRDDQVFWNSKGRKSVAKHVKIKRAFDYQKFMERT